ncbi:MAG: nucleotide exchange factor GrpE [Bacteroidetes bacterium]|nr:MAG: nucleotide exchange factor GrpE [Bacteroidota bacterium]
MNNELNKQAEEQQIPQSQQQENHKQKKGKKGEASLTELEKAQREIARLQEELKTAQEENAKSQDQYIRLQAEWDNFRKRKDRELTERLRFAYEDLIKELLPILDNFDRTLKSIEKTDNLEAVKEGIELVAKNMRKQFEKVGLQPIESLNKDFDYELHEAISSVPVEEEEKKGKVIDEVEKGYKLNDKVIRFSKVVVGE